MGLKISSTVFAISGLIIGFIISVIGLWAWGKYDYPVNEIIPSQSTFGSNPIHLLYIGLLIFFGSIINGVFQCGWFISKK